jgi:hypothetical protein
LNICCIDIFIS